MSAEVKGVTVPLSGSMVLKPILIANIVSDDSQNVTNSSNSHVKTTEAR